MLITSESLRVKLCYVIHCYLNFTQVRNIQDFSFPYKFVQTSAYQACRAVAVFNTNAYFAILTSTD